MRWIGWWVWGVLACGRSGPPPASAIEVPSPLIGDNKLVVQLGHRSRITHLAITPDGAYAISADTEPEVLVWDVDNAVLLHQLRLHDDTIRDLALSPQGRRVATASDDGRVGLWDVRSGTLLHAFDHPDEVESVVFTADGRTLLTGCHDGKARQFDVVSGELRREVTHGGWVELDRLEDGRFATRSIGEVQVFGPDQMAPITRIASNESFGTSAVRADGERVAIVRETAITVFSASGAERGTFVAHDDEITKVAFSPHGDLVTTSRDGTAKVWNSDSLKLRTTFDGHGDAVLDVQFTPDGRGAVTVGGDYRARIWDLRSGEERLAVGGIETDEGFPMITVGAVLGPDGTLITGQMDGVLRAWNAERGELDAILRYRAELTFSLDPSPDGRHLAVAHGTEVDVWDLTFGRPVRTLDEHLLSVQQVRYSPDGSTLFTAAQDSGVIVWDARSGEPQAVLAGEHTDGLRDLAVAPDGRTVLTGGEDDLAVWWDVDTQSAKQRLEGHSGDVWAVAISPDGTRAITGGENGEAFIWDLATGQVQATVTFDPQRTPERRPTVLTATFDPDGRTALLGVTRTLHRIDATTGDPLTSSTFDHPVGSIRYAPDGKDLVVGTWDGVTALYDPATLTLRERFDPLGSFVLDAQAVPDAPFVASAGLDGTVHVFARGQPRPEAIVINAIDGWAVADADGRYDADGPDAEELAVWVIDGEPYGLSQLRDEFFDPGLLGKALGIGASPLRDVPALAAIAPPARPVVDGPTPNGRLTLALEDRGGGIGALFVTLNDSDISTFVATACPELPARCVIDLSGLSTWAEGLDNRVRVRVANRDGSVQSRGLEVVVRGAGAPPGDPPDLWVLAVGTSDYAGSRLDLGYPALDSSRIASALRVAGRQGFGPDRTHVRVLATDALPLVHALPSRASVEEGFAWLRGSDPLDTVVVFFAGHGVAYADPEQGVDDYFYLLPSVASIADLETPALRKIRAWSGDDLADALATVPARKRVVVLDTCAAGKLDQSLTVERMLSSDAIRAHARARHRTGAWMLAGAAADQVSYEANRFGQGLLTYALLEAMRGPALDEGHQLWVSRWFAHAEAQVPTYAVDIGGVQRPVLRYGRSDFPLGEVPPDARRRIILNPVKPVVLRSIVVAEGARPDRLGLGRAIDLALRNKAASGGSIVWWDVDAAPNAVQLSGEYLETEEGIAFSGFMTRDAVERPVRVNASNLDEGVAAIVERLVQFAISGG